MSEQEWTAESLWEFIGGKIDNLSEQLSKEDALECYSVINTALAAEREKVQPLAERSEQQELACVVQNILNVCNVTHPDKVVSYDPLTQRERVTKLVESSLAAERQNRDEARQQREWLIKECGRIGVTVNVSIGAPLAQAYVLENTALARMAKESQRVPDQCK